MGGTRLNSGNIAAGDAYYTAYDPNDPENNTPIEIAYCTAIGPCSGGRSASEIAIGFFIDGWYSEFNATAPSYSVSNFWTSDLMFNCGGMATATVENITITPIY